MGGRKRLSWVADFETTTKANDCRVWGWGLCDVEKASELDDVEIGQDISGFVDRLMKMPSAIVYFHNLKFDGKFILDWLLRNGYAHTMDTTRPGFFNSLISNMGSFYSITVHWMNGKKTEFRDSWKKLPMSADRVAKSFKLPEAKGHIDYHAERPVGHILTPEEREYLATDVLIISRALKMQFSTGMKKMTVGSDALAEFKRMHTSKLFDRMFPVLPATMDAELRQAYKGGFTYADPRFQGKITRKGRTYDVNSLYPSVMYDRLLPYGEPIYAEGLPSPTPERPLFIASITFTAKLKPGHIPCIQVKGSASFISTEYQTEIKDPVTLMCSNVDLALWQDHYDMDVLAYNGGWLFQGITGVFTEYIDKWMNVKTNNDGGIKEIAKLHLNSLYGKFGTNPNVTQKIPVLENDVVKLKLGPPEMKDPIYIPLGVFITAYARDVTIRAAQQHYDSFAYADTDSLHLLVDEDPTTLEVDPKKLGAWKREYLFDAALFIRAKTYTELVSPGHCHNEDDDHEHQPHGCHVTHIAGLPVSVAKQLTFDDFVGGRKFSGKLNPKTVPGGVILDDVGFTMPVF